MTTRTKGQLDNKSNRISDVNDKVLQLWSNLTNNKVPRNFEAIILSGYNQQSNSPNTNFNPTNQFGNNNDNRYYFVRIRPLMTTDNILPDPFLAKDKNTIRKIINMHPIASIPVNDTIHPPVHGDVFLCRYTRKDRLGFSLVKRLRNSNKSISDISNRDMHDSFAANNPTVLGRQPETQVESGVDLGPPIDSSTLKPYGADERRKNRLKKLYKDLKAVNFSYNLILAILANADAESRILANNNGDKSSARNGLDVSKYGNTFVHSDRGFCCSFGLWQYNICAGLGIRLLGYYGVSKNAPDDEKIPILTSYDKQVEYMVYYLKNKNEYFVGQWQEEKSIDEWTYRFVYQVEKPGDKKGAYRHRRVVARKMDIYLESEGLK